MGQTQSVILHHILCEDTLDARVMAALERKNTTQRELLDALKEYLNDEKTR
jgi:SNF2 family DNA or RNA helicase